MCIRTHQWLPVSLKVGLTLFPWATVFPAMSQARPTPLTISILAPTLPPFMFGPGSVYQATYTRNILLDFHLALSVTSFRLCLINHFKIERSFWHCYIKSILSFYLYVLYFLSTCIVTCHLIIMPLFISPLEYEFCKHHT